MNNSFDLNAQEDFEETPDPETAIVELVTGLNGNQLGVIENALRSSSSGVDDILDLPTDETEITGPRLMEIGRMIMESLNEDQRSEMLRTATQLGQRIADSGIDPQTIIDQLESGDQLPMRDMADIFLDVDKIDDKMRLAKDGKSDQGRLF